MKENKLRTIIREELTSVLLTEALKSGFLRKLFAQSGRWDGNAMKKGFTKMGYDLANYTDADISKYNGTAKSLKGQKGLFVIIAKGKNDTEQSYRTGGRYGWTNNVKNGQILAMAINGQVAYITKDGVGPKMNYSRFGQSKIGIDAQGYRSFKALDNAFTFEIYKLNKPADQEADMRAKQALRQKQKFGATAFMTDKQFRDINQRKFQAILKNKAAKGLDEVPKLVQKAMAAANEAIAKAYEDPKLGRYDDLLATFAGKQTTVRDVSYEMARIHELFATIIQAQNNAAKEADNDYGSKYYQDRLKGLALDFKTKYQAFITGKFIR